MIELFILVICVLLGVGIYFDYRDFKIRRKLLRQIRDRFVESENLQIKFLIQIKDCAERTQKLIQEIHDKEGN